MRYRVLHVVILIPMTFITIVTAQGSIRKGQSLVERSPVRYVEVYNYIDPPMDETDVPRRFIEVLIDKKSFSVEKLTKTARLISYRFKIPVLMYVTFFSSIEDVQTPEERDSPAGSGEEYSIGPTPNSTATFVRLKDKRQRLIIRFANGDVREIEIK